MDLPEKRIGAFGRLTLHRCGADDGARSGFDVEFEQRAVGIVPLGRDGRHGRAQIPVIVIQLFDGAGGILGTPYGRRRPEPIRHDAAHQPLGQAERRLPAKIDALHAVPRHEVVAQQHATRGRNGLDLNILKAAEPEDVHDGFADLHHRERLAGARLHKGVHGAGRRAAALPSRAARRRYVPHVRRGELAEG